MPEIGAVSLALVRAGSLGKKRLHVLHDGPSDPIASPGVLETGVNIAKRAAARVGGMALPELVTADYSGIGALADGSIESHYDLLAVARPDEVIPANAHRVPLS